MKTHTHPWGTATLSDGPDAVMTVSDGVQSYVVDLKACHADRRGRMAATAPRPTDELDGASVRFVRAYGEKPGYVGDEAVVQVTSSHALGTGYADEGSYYPWKGFGDVQPIELAPEPKFAVYASDDTENWSEDVVAVTGRIQAVYLYDENEHTHLCETTPSHRLDFLYNASENALGDDDQELEEGEERRPSVPGYDFVMDFEHENGGEGITYTHASDVERADAAFKHALGPVNPTELETYRCAPERLREAYYELIRKEFVEEASNNRVFEGHFETEASPAP